MKQPIILFDIKIQSYLLKHFSCIDEDYRNYLLQQEVTNSYIEFQLKIPGSKFFTIFASNPQILYERIISIPRFFENTEAKTTNNSTIVIMHQYDKSAFQTGIGSDNLIDITKNNINCPIRFGLRNAQLIKFIEVEPKPSWQMHVILEKINENSFCIKSAFPGTFAPVLPNICKQSIADFLESSTFWKNHAFISNSNQDIFPSKVDQ